jgi:hypothetical protein
LVEIFWFLRKEECFVGFILADLTAPRDQSGFILADLTAPQDQSQVSAHVTPVKFYNTANIRMPL